MKEAIKHKMHVQHLDNLNKGVASLTDFGTEATTFGVPSTRAIMNKIGLNNLDFKFTIRPNDDYRYSDREPGEYEKLKRNNDQMVSPRDALDSYGEDPIPNTVPNSSLSRRSLNPQRNI